MRTRSSLLVIAVFLSVIANSSTTNASQPHHWCVPGDRLILDDLDTDANTNALIHYVCDQVRYQHCCMYTIRWDISCVEQGEAYYAANLGSDDVCGRASWALGPLPGTSQYYPRDFNLFTLGDPQNSSYSGDATGMQDVQGAIAVQGSINTSWANINWGQHDKVGVVANQAFNMTSGTVYGRVYYGSTANGFPSVTFRSPPPIVTSTPVIDFADAATKLGAMSGALRRYTFGRPYVTKQYNTITFYGTDPELNAFKVSSTEILGAYNYVIDAPTSSVVIINVEGSNPAIYSCGFDRRNNVPTNHILWNFPDAATLQIQSVGFPGSILAPFAEADLRWGVINGTVVAKRVVPTWIELHWAPFEFPVTGGCLDRDPEWSCSADTRIDDSGRALSLAPEAGFLEFPGGTYTSEGQPRQSPTHRVWYSFQPAMQGSQQDPSVESRPLAVLFNGGPGVATSAGLFSFNTGPWTLDPLMVGSSNLASNTSNSWTRYFNLLYIDAPGTGFSYSLPAPGGGTPAVGTDMYRDAALVARVVLRFLDRHPAVRGNPVVLVGESYGGDRATIMLDQLLNFSEGELEFCCNSQYGDAPYCTDLLSHFGRLLGPGNVTRAGIAQQFGRQVLIQPNVLGYYQVSGLGLPASFSVDTSRCSHPSTGSYNCGEEFPWYWAQVVGAANNLAHIANGTLETVLGVNPRTIRWLLRGERAEAYGRGSDLHPIAVDRKTEFAAQLGGSLLGQDDNYFVVLNPQVHAAVGSSYASDHSIAQRFVSNVTWVKTLITNADFDLAVPTTAIPYSLDSYRGLFGLSAVTTDTNGGWITLNYQPNGDPRLIRFPEYPDAGHSVSMARSVGTLAAPTFLADIQAWF